MNKTAIGDYAKVSDIPLTFELVQVDTSVADILQSIGYADTDHFDHLLVEVLDGEFGEVWGCDGTPYLNAQVERLQ